MNCRRKPVSADARQLTADNLVSVADWISDTGRRCDQYETHIYIGGLPPVLGEPWGNPGDWVIREFGSFRIVSDRHFAEAYEVTG